MHVLAQTYGNTSSGSSVGSFVLIYLIFYFAFSAFMFWAVFTKAGKPGWASLIPIWNSIVLLEVAGRPAWWFILYFIPFVDLVIWIIVLIDVSKSFGKGGGFTVGLFFLPIVFFPILGFGSASYLGPAGTGMTTPGTPGFGAPPTPPPPPPPPPPTS